MEWSERCFQTTSLSTLSEVLGGGSTPRANDYQQWSRRSIGIGVDIQVRLIGKRNDNFELQLEMQFEWAIYNQCTYVAGYR